MAVRAAAGSLSAVRQRNAKSALAVRAGATGAAIAIRPDNPPERRNVVLVTAELMGDPKPNYVRAELRQDEGRSAPVGQDDLREGWGSPTTMGGRLKEGVGFGDGRAGQSLSD